MTFLVRDAEDGELAQPLAAAQLQDIQASAFADDVPLELPRMHFWADATARRWFQGGGGTGSLPWHWHAACLTHPMPSAHIVQARAASIDFLIGGTRDRFTCKNGQVELDPQRAPAEVKPWLDALGECGDVACGCNRMSRPHVREEFVRRVVETVCALDCGKGVRYVTFGCGQLLTDAEILAALQRRGVTIASVVAVDAALITGCCRPSWRAGVAVEQRGPPPDRIMAALDQLARLMAPTEVYGFCGLAPFIDACHAVPTQFGGADIVVRCDAVAINEHAARLASVCALRPGGRLCELANLGSHGSSAASTTRTVDCACPNDSKPPRLMSFWQRVDRAGVFCPSGLSRSIGCAAHEEEDVQRQGSLMYMWTGGNGGASLEDEWPELPLVECWHSDG